VAYVGKRWLDWPILLGFGSWIVLALSGILGMMLLIGCVTHKWETITSTAAWQFKLSFIAAWLAITVRHFQFALLPAEIDRGASDDQRKAAVYATELLLSFTIAATYFAYPKLFDGWLMHWWPVIVFAVAMLSAGLGKWCLQTGRTILGDPVSRSSLLLPVLPLVGVWWPTEGPASVDWSDWQRYAFLLLSAGILYGIHSWFRPSLALRGLAVGFTLLSFWSLLHSRPSLRFLEHPQLWLLPPALATLVFIERNRDRMRSSEVVAMRYVATLVAYLSSTADMLLKAFEGQMWQPVILLMLATAGVIAGIVLHVRAFLYCGTAFVGVALIGMVWHAQQAIDQVWPWWVFGIVTGIGLIVLLGYFEKNKPRVLAYLEQLKAWEL
jgi:hypothetical protein